MATRKILTEIPRSTKCAFKDMDPSKTYWTYHYDRHWRNGRISEHKKPFQVRRYWDELEQRTNGHPEWTRCYINTHDLSFFETEEECIGHHDESFLELARKVDTKERKKLYSKLIKKQKIEQLPIEKEMLAWLKTLTPRQIEYVQWIKEYYSEPIK